MEEAKQHSWLGEWPDQGFVRASLLVDVQPHPVPSRPIQTSPPLTHPHDDRTTPPLDHPPAARPQRGQKVPLEGAVELGDGYPGVRYAEVQSPATGCDTGTNLLARVNGRVFVDGNLHNCYY